MTDTTLRAGATSEPVRLLALGATALLVLAAAWAWLGLVMTSADGWTFADDAVVAVDGRRHTVATATDAPTYVWTLGTALPGCTVLDARGEKVPVTRTADGPRLPGGSVGDWVARASFDSPTATARVSCEAGGRWSVAVAGAPAFPTAQMLTDRPLPLVLGGVGLLGLLVAAALGLPARRAARRATAAGSPW
ncbi:hypothetical protein [Nocardioides bruguierae]|uniref:Uncharacterized protein n=1 Tax=Nocardioides bruguierae TaxID=2945102 RepID=A0A9X2IDQ8_9ACTN|nr:hypothetical protein [Nocardioides bruguierae]MCL8027192.1 hypothetical protein [Nocardioides bruguierae]MCM0620016.1 hypothetical protein [Nocardioides bruguierae]